MITLFGALMVSSVAMADEVNTNPTSEIPATAQPVATNSSTPTTTSEEGATTEATVFAIRINTNCDCRSTGQCSSINYL